MPLGVQTETQTAGQEVQADLAETHNEFKEFEGQEKCAPGLTAGDVCPSR